MIKGTVFAVKHFAVHDGPGIRTTLFLKGCPLRCVWCHNPEGLNFSPEPALYKHKCTDCKNCAEICKKGAHVFSEDNRRIDREKCIACGECASVCPFDALEFFGRTVTPEAILPELLEDRDFYINSHGGVTLSGGECLMQADFCQSLLKLLKDEGIHTAVDTCGFVQKNAFIKVMPYTDMFLYDIKAFSEETHIKCTGQANLQIWDNLEFVTKTKPVIVRVPFVPEYNGHELAFIARRLSEFENILKVDILAYHNFSGSKYAALDIKNTMPRVKPPTAAQLADAREIFKKYGLRVN